MQKRHCRKCGSASCVQIILLFRLFLNDPVNPCEQFVKIVIAGMGNAPWMGNVGIDACRMEFSFQHVGNSEGSVSVRGAMADAHMLCLERSGIIDVLHRVHHLDLDVFRFGSVFRIILFREIREVAELDVFGSEEFVFGRSHGDIVEGRRCLHSGAVFNESFPVDGNGSAVFKCEPGGDFVICFKVCSLCHFFCG